MCVCIRETKRNKGEEEIKGEGEGEIRQFAHV